MKKRKKNNKNLLLALIAVLVAVLIAAIILMVVLAKGETGSQGTGSNSQPTGETQSTFGTEPAGGDTTSGNNEPSEGTTPPTDSMTKPTEAITQPTKPTEAVTQPTERPTDPTQGILPEPPTESTTAPTAPEDGDEMIQTPYCTLYYPGEYKDKLEVQKVQGQPYKVTFIARFSDSKAAKLFAIVFGGTPEYPAGTIRLSDGTAVTVSVENYELQTDTTWSVTESQTAFAMQEALNYVLQNMHLEQGDSQRPQGGTDLTVNTPYCDLHFPAKWDGYVTTEHQRNGAAYSVEFYGTVPGHSNQLLFVVHFNSDEGTQVATVGNVLVSLTVSELAPDASWSDADKNTLYAIQEDMNYLISKLNG